MMEGTATPEMEPQSSTTRAPGQFVKFPKLPTDIQLLVWKHAVPNPRSILGSILFILNLDLDDVYAILPSIQDIKHTFFNNYNFLRFLGLDSDAEYSKLLEMLDASMTVWRAVLSLHHTCRASRGTTLGTYRLDLESIIEAENTPLWTADDIVYFPWQESMEGLHHAGIHWFFQARENPRPSLASLQHAAFLLTHKLFRTLKLNVAATPGTPKSAWAKNFPSLQSFSLFLDPGEVGYSQSGKILLYEPQDVPVQDVENLTPSQIAQRMSARLRQPGMQDEDVPLAEVFVVDMARKSK